MTAPLTYADKHWLNENMEPSVNPEWSDDDMPWCRETCLSHDGKRCRIMGRRPTWLCEPAVKTLISLVLARRPP